MTFVNQFLKNIFSFFTGNLEIKILERTYLLISPLTGALTFLENEHLSYFSAASGNGEKVGVQRTKGRELLQSACRCHRE